MVVVTYDSNRKTTSSVSAKHGDDVRLHPVVAVIESDLNEIHYPGECQWCDFLRSKIWLRQDARLALGIGDENINLYRRIGDLERELASAINTREENITRVDSDCNVHRYFRRKRMACGLTQHQFAALLGISRTYVARVENEKHPRPASHGYSRKHWPILVAHIGCKVEDLARFARNTRTRQSRVERRAIVCAEKQESR